MSSDTHDSVQAQAIEWHIRLRQGDDATWEAFAAWMAEDERHAAAYDIVEQDDLVLDELLPHVTFREAANDQPEEIHAQPELQPQPQRRRWAWALAGGGIAASVAAVIGVSLVPFDRQELYQVATASGEVRVVTLDPETSVTLNGATRMTFDRNDPRFASLEGGEAFFRVRHDIENPFRLTVGGDVVEDAGTEFNVVHEAGEVRVAVREGKVVYNPAGSAIALIAGQSLVDRADADTVKLGKVAIDAVGSWQGRSLVYAGAPLAQVAADLSRSLGARISASPDVSARPFSGTIMLDSSGTAQLDRLGRVLDLTIERGPDGWVMKPVGSAAR